jgi:ADP-ribose pyrophosphatase YjhB (NUDIX family)
MSDSERVHVDVVVALVTDPTQRVLLTLNENWGSFTLPMTRRRRGRQINEPPTRAALRAAAEAVGVPIRLVEESRSPRSLPARLESSRQLVDKIYTYSVFHIEPHPDFADRLQIRQPHLWLSPHLVLSGIYEPISESARFILRGILADFGIPARVQHTSVLIFRRDDPQRGRQFLVRWGPSWGYALPAKRWEPPAAQKPEDHAAAAMAAAERAAREELGLEPGTDVTLAPAQVPEVTNHGVSRTEGAPAFGEATDYVHSLFDTKLHHPAKLHSHSPLAWITEEEVQYGWTAASQGEPGAPSDHPGRVSLTTYEILLNLGLVTETLDPEIEAMARKWLEEHGVGLG